MTGAGRTRAVRVMRGGRKPCGGEDTGLVRGAWQCEGRCMVTGRKGCEVSEEQEKEQSTMAGMSSKH